MEFVPYSSAAVLKSLFDWIAINIVSNSTCTIHILQTVSQKQYIRRVSFVYLTVNARLSTSVTVCTDTEMRLSTIQ